MIVHIPLLELNYEESIKDVELEQHPKAQDWRGKTSDPMATTFRDPRQEHEERIDQLGDISSTCRRVHASKLSFDQQFLNVQSKSYLVAFLNLVQLFMTIVSSVHELCQEEWPIIITNL